MLGNLESDGKGISGFTTLLSIGLGQSQEFHLILQTLQQLKDLYGDTSDKTIQGNAQPLYSKILTPNGWVKMGDIKVGDEVLTPFGTVTKVVGVYPKGIRKVYRLTLRDGSTTDCCNEHLWQIERFKSVSNSDKTCKLIQEVINTDDLKMRISVKSHRIGLPEIKPVVLNKKDLPVDPYVLGVILGDGHIDARGVCSVTTKDVEILNEIERRGYNVVFVKHSLYTYRVNGINSKMVNLQLNGKKSYEKFIPEIYKNSSIEDRIDLLRGLMDTDGYISKKSEIEFTSVSEILAKDVQYLIRSLGGRVNINFKKNNYYTSPTQLTKKKARPAYRLQNVRINSFNPFFIERKACLYKELFGRFNTIKSIDFVGYDEVQCIKVEDERHLYITDDFIPTHNTSNIIYIKSSDDSLIDTFVKMTGVTHRVYGSSKTVTRDLEKLWMKNKGEVSLSYSAVEEPVISYNDFYFIAERNSIVLRAGDPPVWNRNETILPMAWRLYKDTIKLPGKEFTLSTIPSLSNITDFDIRKNQPDFGKMFTKKLEQAAEVERAVDRYAEVYGYSDYDIAQLDPDLYADDIMDIIRDCMEAKNEDFSDDFRPYDPEFDEKPSVSFDRSKLVNNNRTSGYFTSGSTSNEEFKKAYIENEKNEKIKNAKIYAGGLVSRSDLYDPHGGGCLGTYDECIIASYVSCMTDFSNSVDFEVENGTRILRLRKNGEILINVEGMTQAAIDKINKEIGDPNSRSFGNKKLTLDDATKYKVTPAFIEYLISLDSWKGIAGGSFEDKMRESVANFINESNGEKRDKNY